MSGLFRRVVLAPLLIVLTVLLLTTIPLWLLVAIVLSPVVKGRLRPLRLLSLMLMHLVLESLMLVELFGLWIASGFGIFIRRPFFQRIHYDIVQTYLVVFFREARRVLRLKIVTEGPAPDAHPGEPLLVCCRHAGPGDSFTLMYALMHWYGREPRVVLKDTLAWDPAIDVILNRLPSRFISPGRPGQDLEQQVGALAANLDENDAFVIFPEGGNFTPARRQKAIDKLRRMGLEAMAQRAERMENVLAPGRAVCSRRWTPLRTPTWSWSRTPGSTTCSRSATCGASCRWTSRSSCAGGGCPARRSPRDGRSASTGSTPGGSASTSGSTSTGPWTCRPGAGVPAAAALPPVQPGRTGAADPRPAAPRAVRAVSPA
ncbi:1-acyl-sn-glycerol-3-phosphate acyltransferase [Nocardioides mesophilus]|uniref:1-acyl-sn-glycerol-3-phosphate acyltransferase n=1 Tax=Nocardioides mesophilus TaxID=433659 RepID=UPI001CB6CE2B|nr:1-acyl-sn-glycerol-3-phosphate acyltransferase [Nocardioides mesophilus]